MGVLMSFVQDVLERAVQRKTLLAFMTRNGYAYAVGIPTDEPRAVLDPAVLAAFYNTTLPNKLRGVHRSLVFNADEMGTEAFADRKLIRVFVPQRLAPESGSIQVGVPRSSRRCTLIACGSLDGTTLPPAIIVKTKNISSRVFEEGGFDQDRLRFYSTENSFITSDVFGAWLCEVLIPEVFRRREVLRQRLGAFNPNAVLIMDGCTVHQKPELLQLLRNHRIKPVFLVPHSSHLTQPLDVGIFWRTKNLIRTDTRYAINLHDLDEAIANDADAENLPDGDGQQAQAVRRRRTETGRLLADYVLRILRAFRDATFDTNVVSSFAQVGIHADTTEDGSGTAFVDPTTARLVVERCGPLLNAVPAPPRPPRNLRIEELNSAFQSTLSRQLHNELAAIRAAQPAQPPANRRRSRTTHTLTHRGRRPAAAPPAPAAPAPPRPTVPHALRSAFRAASRRSHN